MPRRCNICVHNERTAIDAALAGNESFRYIAVHYGVSKGSLQRHKENHLPVSLVHAQEAANISNADSLLAHVRELQEKTLSILERAEAAGDLRTAVSAIAQARGNLELLARLLGELQTQPVVNILVDPQFIQFRDLVLGVLSGFPEVKMKVIETLKEYLEKPD